MEMHLEESQDAWGKATTYSLRQEKNAILAQYRVTVS